VTKASTRRFFFGGTLLFTLVFVGLTLHTHTTISARTHDDAITDEVRRGLGVWGRYNCENCHTLLGEGAYFAPDLTQIVAQRGTVYLGAFLADPSRFYSEERHGRLMPTLGLSEREITDVIAFLDWVGRIDTNGWPPRPLLVSGAAVRGLPGIEPSSEASGAAARGWALFEGAGACSTCHAVAGDTVVLGPSLAGIGRRAAERVGDPGYAGQAKDAQAYLRESILEPSAYLVPGANFATPTRVSLMPAVYQQQLAPAQVDDLVAYLGTLQ
jgi:nitric oxide reductase subunit C